MFALFFSLYYSMFIGSWQMYSFNQITNEIAGPLNLSAKFLTSIFGDFQVTDFGSAVTTQSWLSLVSFILALITSIGIVIVATKGIKKIFTVFFYGVR